MKQNGGTVKFRGFTLIELLVVISIVSILATVLLINMRGARDHGINANIISQMSSLPIEGQIHYQQYGNYNGLCGATYFSAIVTRVDGLAEYDVSCDSGPNRWRAYIRLNGTPIKYFCVDSAGNSGESTGIPGMTCP